jgi:hypothetical protein
MASKKKSMKINIDPEKVVYTNISKTQDYNSARMVVKVADKEYMTVSYEWEGSHVPDFAMSLMSFMQANEIETSGVWPGKETEYAEFNKEDE